LSQPDATSSSSNTLPVLVRHWLRAGCAPFVARMVTIAMEWLCVVEMERFPAVRALAVRPTQPLLYMYLRSLTISVCRIADVAADTHVDVLPPNTLTVELTFAGVSSAIMDGDNPLPEYSLNLRTELAAVWSVETAQVRIQGMEPVPFSSDTGFTFRVDIAVLPSVLGEGLSADAVSNMAIGTRIADHGLTQVAHVNIVAPPVVEDDSPPPPPEGGGGPPPAAVSISSLDSFGLMSNRYLVLC
jgi:hypothetical protein